MEQVTHHRDTSHGGDGVLYDEALWRDYSRIYDEVLNVIPYRNLLMEIVEVAAIEDGMRLFDGCCGTGNLFWALGQQNSRCHVTGVDFSKDMLAKAQTKLENYAGTGELVRTNLDEPVDKWGVTGQFDRFIFNNCLAFLSDPADVLRKSSELAAPGAVLVASTPRPNPNINELLEDQLRLSEDIGISREEALRRLVPALQPIISCNERLMKQYGDSYHLPNTHQLKNWFKGSGWKISDATTTYAGQNWLVIATKDPA